MVTSQAVVCLPRVNVRTSVDGVGVDADGVVWIIELKNTQRTLSEHAAMYNIACPGNGVLANGMCNSESVRHRLQAGFGVAGFRLANPGVAVRGLVIVNCTNGAVGHSVDASVYGSAGSFPAGRQTIVDGGPWDRQSPTLRRVVARLGFDPRTHRQSGAGKIGLYRNSAGNRRLAIGVGKRHSPILRKNKADVRAIVITNRDGVFVAETV